MKKGLFLVVGLAVGCAPNPGLVVDKIVKNYGNIQQLEEKVECYVAPLGVSLNGTTYYKSPDKIAGDFGQPMEAKIVSDGKDMWISVPAYQTVLKMGMNDKNAEVSPSHIKTFLFPEKALGALAEKYEAKKVKSGKLSGTSVSILEMVPKASDSEIATVTLWVENESGAIRKYETKDKDGQVRCRLLCDSITNVGGTFLAKEMRVEEGNGNPVGTMTVSDIKLNQAISDSLFSFKPPKGLMVIEEMPVLGIPMPDILPLE